MWRAVAAASLLLLTGCIQAPVDRIDLLITNGTIIDGAGKPGYVGNVWIDDGRIVDIGGSTETTAAKTIDATGLIVSPGFIDPHTHADRDLKDPATSHNPAYLFQGVTTVFIGNDGRGSHVANTLALLEQQGVGTNVAMLSGHGSLRLQVIGIANRAPSSDELDDMLQRFRDDLAAGAFGLSTGLFYAPGSFAGTSEVIELAKEMQSTGGVYETHLRDESNYTVGLSAAIDEALRIGRVANVPVHLGHLKALGPALHGESVNIIEQVNLAQAAGQTVTADQYPWLASGTRLSNALLPRQIMADGKDAMHAILKAKPLGPDLESAIKANLVRRGGADALLITGESRFRGQTLRQAADSAGQSVIDTAIQIVLAGDPAVASFMMSEEDVRRLGQQPWVVTSSDGSTGHPRKYGSFPEKYQKFVRDWQLMPIETFVQRSSGDTAAIFGICRRGLITSGYWADIVIWDPNEFRSRANYENPESLAAGVEHVFINGKQVINAGQFTGIKPGRGLRRQSCDEN